MSNPTRGGVAMGHGDAPVPGHAVLPGSILPGPGRPPAQGNLHVDDFSGVDGGRREEAQQQSTGGEVVDANSGGK